MPYFLGIPCPPQKNLWSAFIYSSLQVLKAVTYSKTETFEESSVQTGKQEKRESSNQEISPLPNCCLVASGYLPSDLHAHLYNGRWTLLFLCLPTLPKIL